MIVTDLNMPGTSRPRRVERVAANRADMPVVVITAFGSLETAVAAIRAGAYDFVTKPFEIDAVALTLERAVGTAALRDGGPPPAPAAADRWTSTRSACPGPR